MTGVDLCPSCGQPIQSGERRTRDAIRGALAEQDMTQAELAERLGITQKHMSSLMTGKTALSFDFAERCLGVLGRRLVTSVEEFDG